MLTLSENAKVVLEKRYLTKDDKGEVMETPEEMFVRVARAIAEPERRFGATHSEARRLEAEFFDLMTTRDFMPNSPTLMNAGRPLGQLSACFVLPVEDSMEGIFSSIKNAALIHKSGGGTGFAFSRLRPASDTVSSTGGVASGPISFMRVFNAATEAVKQGGKRRGANMGIMRVDHPDILDFITCKKDKVSITNFNISVAVTEVFMKAALAGEDYELINPRTREAVKKLSARKVFDLIVNLAWQNGDPGIVFIDRINWDNPTPAVGEMEATNPCGEQPLLPYEACNLGSVNLANMVVPGNGLPPAVDWVKLAQVTRQSIHFLDNVIEANQYPLREIHEIVMANRKIGLGVMGFADFLIELGIPYNSEEAVRAAEEVMAFVEEHASEASQELAGKRGPFPNYPGSVFARPELAKERNAFRHIGGKLCGKPRRNATVTTVAPTGTIAIIAGCSSGIEPLFAVSYERKTPTYHLVETNPLFEEVARKQGFHSEDLMKRIAQSNSIQNFPEVPEDVRRVFVTAHDVSPEWHVRIQAAFQKYTENAVSKTVNFPHDASPEDVRRVYLLACELGCKGITIYRDGSRDVQVLSVKKEAEEQGDSGAEEQTAAQGEVQSRQIVPRDRPALTYGVTEKMETGCGNLYVTVNRDSNGLCEIFSTIGKAGGCASAQSEAISRLISLALRSGVEVQSVVKQLKGIRCALPVWKDGELILSCPDALAKVLDHRVIEMGGSPVATEDKLMGEDVLPSLLGAGRVLPPGVPSLPEVRILETTLAGTCPDCGFHLDHEEGCVVCHSCGFSRCG